MSDIKMELRSKFLKQIKLQFLSFVVSSSFVCISLLFYFDFDFDLFLFYFATYSCVSCFGFLLLKVNLIYKYNNILFPICEFFVPIFFPLNLFLLILFMH